jgi:uncharacterized Zn finger protein
MGWRYWGFAPTKPKRVKGGIRSQSKRGSFGESWWAKRWIQVIESFDVGGRLGRGRSYARKGQVLSIDIEKGAVKAKVQGSMPSPYRVTIKVKVLSASDWQKLVDALSRQAIFAAKLLAGEMPQDLEKAFEEAGLALFPSKQKDLSTDCSCPDWSNPCKHIAAVYYLLGEEFDRDPFLIFKLRGMSREELMSALGGPAKPGAGKKVRGKAAVAAAREAAPRAAPEPIGADATLFWGGGDLPENVYGEVRTPPVPAALARRLGGFPFWRGEEPLLDAIEPVYSAASARGLAVFLGDRGERARGG